MHYHWACLQPVEEVEVVRDGGSLCTLSQASLEHYPWVPALTQLPHLEGTLFATLQLYTLLLKIFCTGGAYATRELASKATSQASA